MVVEESGVWHVEGRLFGLGGIAKAELWVPYTSSKALSLSMCACFEAL